MSVVSEVVLRNRNCRACGVVFFVCSHCDRGHATAAKCVDAEPGGNSSAQPIDVTKGRTQAAVCIGCASATIGGGGPRPA
jgi:hypothetical protein